MAYSRIVTSEATNAYSLACHWEKHARSTPGNPLFLLVKRGLEHVSSISDDAGNSWVKFREPRGMYWVENSLSMSVLTVTFDRAGPWEIEMGETEPLPPVNPPGSFVFTGEANVTK